MTPHELGIQLQKIWDDQLAFNMLFRQPPKSPGEMAEQAREFVVYTESEMHELLRTLPWKKHRRMPFRGNPAHMFEEGADVFKCALSLLQIIGIDSPEKLIQLYWQKTAVVRQRYREEWTQKLDRACVIVDIDNVLCDYIGGICDWLPSQFVTRDDHPSPALLDRIERIRKQGSYINAKALEIPEDAWQNLKHAFRTGGHKRRLPVFPDAKDFLMRCQDAGYRIVLLTSRPIDRYQNIFTDTILWLNDNNLPFDFVWWSVDKAERILMEDGLREKVMFAVDDDARFVDQFARAGIPTYWLRRNGDLYTNIANPNITQIRLLSEATIPA
jgi:hypothetical protein